MRYLHCGVRTKPTPPSYAFWRRMLAVRGVDAASSWCPQSRRRPRRAALRSPLRRLRTGRHPRPRRPDGGGGGPRGRHRAPPRHRPPLLSVGQGVPDGPGAGRPPGRPHPDDLLERHPQPGHRSRVAGRSHQGPGRRGQGPRRQGDDPLDVGDGRAPQGQRLQPSGALRRRLAPHPRRLRLPGRHQRLLGLVPQRLGLRRRRQRPEPTTPATTTSTGSAPTGTTGARAGRATNGAASPTSTTPSTPGGRPTGSRSWWANSGLRNETRARRGSGWPTPGTRSRPGSPASRPSSISTPTRTTTGRSTRRRRRWPPTGTWARTPGSRLIPTHFSMARPRLRPPPGFLPDTLPVSSRRYRRNLRPKPASTTSDRFRRTLGPPRQWVCQRCRRRPLNRGSVSSAQSQGVSHPPSVGFALGLAVCCE